MTSLERKITRRHVKNLIKSRSNFSIPYKITEQSIKKKKVKTQFQPPWFDKDCVKLYKKKEKWRQKARSGVKSDLERFRECCKELQDII